jgi:serine/threonine protein phosphatase PrpC
MADMKLNDTASYPDIPHGLAVTTKPPCIVSSFGLTDAGKVRPRNEDQFAIVELARTLSVHHTSVPQAKAQYSSQRGHLFLVADGMGGHRAGDVASELSLLTVEGFILNTLKHFFCLEQSEDHQVLKEFQTALKHADARIFEEMEQHPEWSGMGSTLTLAFAVNWQLMIAHAGDSRCYLFSGGQLHQVTRDHTVAAEMVRHGVLSREDASRHPYRNVVTNILGGDKPGVKVEMHRLDLEAGDLVLICSDGLTTMMTDDEITTILLNEPSVQRMCERLIAEANRRGGEDNITALVARFDVD